MTPPPTRRPRRRTAHLLAPLVAAAVGALAATAAAQQPAPPHTVDSAFAALARDFVFTSLAFSPGAATQAGLHAWTPLGTNRPVLLDSLLDDYSPQAVAAQRRFYRGVRARLAAVPRARLGAQTRADYDVLRDGADAALFSLDGERFREDHPQLYVENAGGALFANMTLEYAPPAARAAHLTARVEQLPAFLATARRTLRATNPVYTKVALDETDGVANLVTGLGATFVRGTPAEARYTAAAPRAVAALRAYQAFARDTLPGRGTVDWRAGAARYAKRWRYDLNVSRTPAQMLALAQDSVRAARREMLALARPMHDRWFPDHRHTGDADAQLNAVVGEVLARIGAEHAPRDSLREAMAADVGLLERRVRERHVLSLDSVPNLQVIPTPEFQRGLFGVAGAVFAPALEPSLATFFWVTPIPRAWPNERAEAKLREYNKYKALDIAMHEAVPGHVVQGAYANRITPEWRRLLRVTGGNTPYVEGWAVYAEHVMMYDAGVDGGDAAKMRLTDLKGMLRVYTNAILDIRLHTQRWPGDSAVAMMMRDAFQERPEAEAKLQRAQLGYVQLVSYLAGVADWTSFRQEAERREGSAFDLCRFHDTVLLYGPLPVPVVRRLYFDHVAPTASAPPSRCARGATRTAAGAHAGAAAPAADAVRQSRPAGDASCTAAFDSMLVVLRRDYPGYQMRVPGHEAAFAALVDSVRAVAATPAADASYDVCMPALHRVTGFFRDAHLLVWQGPPPAPTATAPTAAATTSASAASAPPTGAPDDPVRPMLRRYDARTLVLRLPDLDRRYKSVVGSLVAAHRTELTTTPNLVVDLRGDGGGCTCTYDALMPLIATRPVRGDRLDVWASPANVAFFRALAAEPGAPDTLRADIRRLLPRLEAAPNAFVPMSADSGAADYTPPSVLPLPHAVAVLVDSACASSCEDFVAAARQSRKVTVYSATNTGGASDYGDIRTVMLPGWRRLRVATSRSARSARLRAGPQAGTDFVGLAPDVRLPRDRATGDAAIAFALGDLAARPPAGT